MGADLGQPKMAQMPTDSHSTIVDKPIIIFHLLQSICHTHVTGNGLCDRQAQPARRGHYSQALSKPA